MPVTREVEQKAPQSNIWPNPASFSHSYWARQMSINIKTVGLSGGGGLFADNQPIRYCTGAEETLVLQLSVTLYGSRVKKRGDLRPGSDVGMAEGREVSRWRWLGGWPKGWGEGPYEVKRAENRPLPASHSPRSPAEAWVCGIVPLRYSTFPFPSRGPRGCLGNARPLSPALLLRGWGLPDRGLGGLFGRRCV